MVWSLIKSDRYYKRFIGSSNRRLLSTRLPIVSGTIVMEFSRDISL